MARLPSRHSGSDALAVADAVARLVHRHQFLGRRRVLGVHVLGHDAGEMAQLLGIALKAGCTKDDFDRTMAVHPTAAEELVTMYQPSYRIRNGERV